MFTKCLALSAATIFFLSVRSTQTPKKSLEDRSVKILATGPFSWYGVKYLWINGREVLLYADTLVKKNYQSPKTGKPRDNRIWRINVSTQQATTLENLPEVFYSFAAMNATTVSPDGRWLLLSYPANIEVTTTDGKRHLGWGWDFQEQTKFESRGFTRSTYWLADSRHLMRLRGDGAVWPVTAELRNVDFPQRVERKDMNAAELDRFKHDYDEPVILPSGISLTHDRKESRVRKLLRLTPGRKYRLERFQVKAPPGWIFEPFSGGAYVGSNDTTVFSPKGDRVAFICVTPTQRQGNGRPTRKVGIWVSTIRGEKMHEVGHMEADVSGIDEPHIYPIVVECLRWHPDGKRLSFIYKEGLYVVPAD